MKRVGAVLAALLWAASIAHAASIPDRAFRTKPVRFVVASGPGGSTDGLARILGERLGPIWSQAVVYDNRPGAGGMLAGELFMHRAQVKMLSVPYKSIGQSITAVVSGEVPLTFTSVFSAYAQARTGKARALAVTGRPARPQHPKYRPG